MPLPESTPPRRSRHGHFELAAPWYDRVFGRADHSALVEHLNIVPGMTVLDIGGGTGRVAAPLAALGADVTVIDVSPSMLARAHRRGLPVGIALAESLPFRSGGFDRVVVVDAFHHFADQEWAAQELVRVLRPGGKLVVEEPDARRLPVTALAWGEKLARMQSRILPPDEMARVFTAAGGEVTAITPDGWSVHVVVTR